nr:polysaccharide deacetylase family protein [Paenibacillus sp. NEAU-GSW1]
MGRKSSNKKIIALTFDIAEGRSVPMRMIKLLQRLKVKQATFFLTGEWTAQHPSIALLLRKKGYELASHGYLHRNYPLYADSWIEKEVKRAKRAIRIATGVRTNMIRTPGGEINARVARKLQSMGQTIVHWDIDSFDWKLKQTSAIVYRVVPKAFPGAVVLLHACDPWVQSLRAVPRIVSGLRRKGYRFTTVTGLMKQSGRTKLY